MKLTLSQMASRVLKLETQANEAFEYDSGFDAGEFSGPSNHRRLINDVRQALTEGGWNARDFADELHSRVSSRWLFFNFPMNSIEDILNEEYWEAHTYRSNI